MKESGSFSGNVLFQAAIHIVHQVLWGCIFHTDKFYSNFYFMQYINVNLKSLELFTKKKGNIMGLVY